jgi:hypothetical protein
MLDPSSQIKEVGLLPPVCALASLRQERSSRMKQITSTPGPEGRGPTWRASSRGHQSINELISRGNLLRQATWRPGPKPQHVFRPRGLSYHGGTPFFPQPSHPAF